MVRALEPIETFARRNCESILAAKSTASDTASTSSASEPSNNYIMPLDLMIFKCKECDRRFPTFQALGGHRASHMKLRNINQEAAEIKAAGDGFAATRRGRFKTHDCKECRIRFATGQALGGHMRMHAEFARKRKLLAEGVENFQEVVEDLEESKKKIKKAKEFDLNSEPPVEEDELSLQLAIVSAKKSTRSDQD